MNKTYGPKPSEGLVQKELHSLSPQERSNKKAQKLANVKLPKQFSLYGIDITVLGNPYYSNGLLGVVVQAEKDGKPLSIDNPLLYRNPPIAVPDNTWRKEIINSEEKDVPNFKEDLEEAFKTIIAQTICTINKIEY